MKEYRYVKPYIKLNKTVLKLGNIYRLEQIGKYIYNVWSKEHDIKICTITQKCLNYYFEEVK